MLRTFITRFLSESSAEYLLSSYFQRTQRRRRLILDELGGIATYGLTERAWCEFIRLLEEAKYWQSPSTKKWMESTARKWILEGVRDNRYHIVDRFTPDKGKYRKLYLFAQTFRY